MIEGGDVAQTFLVDGFVAGTWTVEDGRVVLEPFAPLSRAVRRELEDEAARSGGVSGRLSRRPPRGAGLRNAAH